MKCGTGTAAPDDEGQFRRGLCTGRPTIGFLTHGAGDPNSTNTWCGVADVARENEVNLFCFPGKPLRSLTQFEAQSNVVFDLIDTESVDGLLIWLGGLAYKVDLNELQAFCERYSPLPIVTVGTLLKGIPGVLVDNYQGMRDVMTHIVDVHGHSQIAFIRGPEFNQEAEQRYQGYLDVLSERGIPFDPKLVVFGNFRQSGGGSAIAELLDCREVEFDALVAASDNMAIGAMKALQARGTRVPGDVAIASLNDEAQSRYVTPPITTVPLRFYQQARRGTEMLLALMEGRHVPEHVVIQTQLLVRQSCGCPAPSVIRAGSDPVPATDGVLSREYVSQLEQTVSQTVEAAELLPEDWSREFIGNLLDCFVMELKGSNSNGFLNLLGDGLRQMALIGGDLSRWNDIISILRQSLLPQVSDEQRYLRAEKLFHQARVLVADTAQREQAYQSLMLREKLRAFSQVNQSLSITTGQAELAEALVAALHLLGIPACYLSLYEDPKSPTEWARLIVAHNRIGRVELKPGTVRFPSRQLAPHEVFSVHEPFCMVVEPLHFREDQLGFVVFEADPREDEIYDLLANQISAALKRTFLFENNTRLYNEAVEAQKVAEEANMLQSRFLSMVSHELRTPLSLIVGTIEMMLQGENAGRVAPLPETYRQDMSVIHASSQHLARLIGDVLDLVSSQAEELRLIREPLNVRQLLGEMVLLGEPMARAKGLIWEEDLPEKLPSVWGDRARLQQVTLNLISNAVKFTEQGKVKLTAQVSDEGLTVTVSDTGMGIPTEEQEVIFDEFRRSERSQRRGYGGMGLGLAISRRLIERHGGRIGVRSTGDEESGSVFFYTLPVLKAPQMDAVEAKNRSHTVLLLAEKNEGADQLRDHLVWHGYEVEVRCVDDSPDWLNHVVMCPPGALVLDFQPAADWVWELILLLRQSSTMRDIPVIFYSFFEDRSLGSMLEMDYHYLAKPLRSTELWRALDHLGLRSKQGKTILIVDDELPILDMHTRKVQSQLPTDRVLQVSDGTEAIRLIQETLPDLVLLDLLMPEVSGFDVLEAMRDREMTRNIPVIVLTAKVLTRQDMARLQKGVAAVLGKSLFSAQDMLAQIEAVLAHSKRLGSESQCIARQAMAYINVHYAEPFSRSELARQLAVSKDHLNRCFREELGITPTTYLNRCRIRRAKELLGTGESSITEVAALSGFSDSNYFSRIFRREAGITPSAYIAGERAIDEQKPA